MSLNIKNAEVERLAGEVAELAGETKTEAIRRALIDRRSRLRGPSRTVQARRLQQFLEREVWSVVPKRLIGGRITSAALDEILGLDERSVC